MAIQNIYTVSDGVYCPDGPEERITQYLTGVFNRLATQVVASREPVDWLVVKSDSLDNVVNGSWNFFDEMFEEALQSATNPKNNISVVRLHGITCGGAISNENILGWIGNRIGPNFEHKYLNEPNLGLSFVGYHLNMR